VSRCPVLYFKVSFDLSSDTSPDPAPQEYERDYFFSSDELRLTSTLDVDISLEHYGSRVAGSPSPQVRADARLDFVQFADGTTWGHDPEKKEDILKVRKATIHELDILKAAFEKSGNEGFVTELTRNRYSPPAISNLQSIYREEGLEKAQATAWRMIKSANNHYQKTRSPRLSGTLSCMPVRK